MSFFEITEEFLRKQATELAGVPESDDKTADATDRVAIAVYYAGSGRTAFCADCRCARPEVNMRQS